MPTSSFSRVVKKYDVLGRTQSLKAAVFKDSAPTRLSPWRIATNKQRPSVSPRLVIERRIEAVAFRTQIFPFTLE